MFTTYSATLFDNMSTKQSRFPQVATLVTFHMAECYHCTDSMMSEIPL